MSLAPTLQFPKFPFPSLSANLQSIFSFPFPFYIPQTFSFYFPTFLFPSLPSFSLPYLPCPFCSSLILIFVFPCQPSHSLLFLFPSFPVPSLTVHFLTYLSPLPILPICYYSPPFSVCLHFSFPCFFLSPPLGSLIPPPPQAGWKNFSHPCIILVTNIPDILTQSTVCYL